MLFFLFIHIYNYVEGLTPMAFRIGDCEDIRVVDRIWAWLSISCANSV